MAMSNMGTPFASGHAIETCANVASMINCNTMFTAIQHFYESMGEMEQEEEGGDEEARAIKEWSRGMQCGGKRVEKDTSACLTKVFLKYLCFPLPDGACPGSKPDVMEGMDANLGEDEEEEEEGICMIEMYNNLTDYEKNALKELLAPLSFFRYYSTLHAAACRSSGIG